MYISISHIIPYYKPYVVICMIGQLQLRGVRRSDRRSLAAAAAAAYEAIAEARGDRRAAVPVGFLECLLHGAAAGGGGSEAAAAREAVEELLAELPEESEPWAAEPKLLALERSLQRLRARRPEPRVSPGRLEGCALGLHRREGKALTAELQAFSWCPQAVERPVVRQAACCVRAAWARPASGHERGPLADEDGCREDGRWLEEEEEEKAEGEEREEREEREEEVEEEDEDQAQDAAASAGEGDDAAPDRAGSRTLRQLWRSAGGRPKSAASPTRAPEVRRRRWAMVTRGSDISPSLSLSLCIYT